MKALFIVFALLLQGTCASGQDARFVFQSPFGSDGTNQPGLDPKMRTLIVFDHVWTSYRLAWMELQKPYPKAYPGGYSQSEINLWSTEARVAQFLEAMAELRAFCLQNGYDKSQLIQPEFSRIDQVLRFLNLFYMGKESGGLMADFCIDADLAKVRASLAPVLLKNDGSLRNVPPPLLLLNPPR